MDKLKCKYILFDLDGTIVESHPGITRSVRYALEKHGYESPSLDELKMYVGPPLSEKFAEVLNISMEKATEMTRTYRERYTTIGKFECDIYSGIKETLLKLKKMGKVVCVATSKPENSAKEVLDHFGMKECFDFIGGDTPEHGRPNKKAVIQYVMDSIGVTDKDDIIMVGDTHYDVIGAAEMGIKCIGVTYGYGELEKLKESGAYIVVDKPKEIGELF